MTKTDAPPEYPTTVEAAVRLIRELLPKHELDKIAAMSEDNLIRLHFGLGMWIRNHLGLWKADSPLLDSLKVGRFGVHPDHASSVIIKALWKQLQADQPRAH